MKMRLELIVLAVVLGAALAAERTSYEGYKVYQLRLTEPQLGLLTQFDGVSGFDFWSRGRVAEVPLDIMVAPQQQDTFLSFLKQHDIKHSVLIEDVEAVFAAERIQQLKASTRTEESRITHNKFYRHAEINSYLEEMAAKYPEIARVQNIGKSTQNRDLKVLTISRGSNNPAIWVDSGIHAREWISPSMALYIIDQLLENEANSDLLDGLDWHILPVMNPDGYEYSHTTTRLWRKTRSTTASASCPGVDANRNWNFHWMEGGSSSLPCSDTYAGPNAFSEPENLAVSKFLTANKNTIKMYLTFHSYGNYFLYPWGYTSTLPSDWRTLDALAQKADAAQQAAGGAPYAIGSSTNVLYIASGGSDDWAKGVANIALAYTVELPGGGPNGFDPPASSIQKIVREFFAAVRVFGEYVQV